MLALGTCITAQALDAEGTLVGGVIAGGLEAQVAGIRATVPHLREPVDAALELLRSGEEAPRMGRSTVENLAAGLAGSLRGTVEALGRRCAPRWAMRQCSPPGEMWSWSWRWEVSSTALSRGWCWKG